MILVPDGLPNGWQTKGAEAYKLYKRLIGKIIIRADANGEAYRVFEFMLQKITFDVSDGALFKILQNCLREKNVFVGVSEEDFQKLSTVIQENKGRIIEKSEGTINLAQLLR